MTPQEFIIDLYYDVPELVYFGLLLTACIGMIIILSFKGIKRGWRIIGALLLLCYTFLLYSTTLFFRKYIDIQKCNFTPFWSYEAIDNGRTDLIAENAMNVVVFIPFGLMLGCCSSRITWRKVLLIGVSISASIEILQFFLHRGFAEIDDMIHNTLGSMIGYGIYAVARYGYKRISKRSVGVL